jgi:SMI1 / KNR4 family (SUKH-1)
MAMNIQRGWRYAFEGLGSPATAQDIASLEAELGVALPNDLRAFYRHANGFDGHLVAGREKSYVRLFTLADVSAYTFGYDIVRDLGGLVLIGGNAGPTAYALDYSVATALYVSVPFMAASRSELRFLGGSFGAFVEALAAGEGW